MSIDPNPKPLQGPWEGDTKIVIGIDIGTTQSGVAFAFLQNGMKQVIHRVTRWPGQEAHNQQSKIPTLVWYDTDKKAVSFGAEAQLYTTEEQAEDNGWFLAKYFKLHLHPRDMQTKHELKLDHVALPPGVSLRQIYSDFLGYLLNHTRTYFEDRILDGKSIWERHSPAMEVIIAHPNGWGLREQHFLRQATTEAGFSTSDQASRKIRFVTEAEASVHFCIHHTSLGNVLRPGMSFAVCDAGGSTVDSTLYLVTAVRPILKLEEKRASACVQAGAIFVDFEVEKFLRKTLANVGLSEDDVDDYTKAGVKDFETVGKQLFGGELETGQNIRISHVRFNNATIGVRRGHMKLSSSTIKGFFDACVKEITGSVDQQLNGFEVLHILLVGGFGNSLHLRKEFKMRYEAQGCRVILTNDSTSWAVADGAVLWYASQSIFRRAPRSSWGIEASAAFDRDDPSHQDRTLIPSTLDRVEARGKWNCLVRKGVPIDVDSTTRVHFFMEISTPGPILDKFELDLYSFSGGDEPVWMRDKQGMVDFHIRSSNTYANFLEGLVGSLESRISAGIRYWRLEFYVCMQFGRTELEAYLEWEEMVSTTGQLWVHSTPHLGNFLAIA
ncbi:heat shock 70 kDa protein 12A [Rhizoctonia solani 123E]|uniref:Heat shock 70 kDa protein 12A n=1 Tax=Rhizoctonia solani 123E TaxID=1423351 RepID=A0A074SAN4_9AGAM|nr:heat shock 70 kDa protein 12A [Rhizoctonia solani 123E]